MRRRWHVPEASTYVVIAIAAYALGWVPVFLTLCGLLDGCDRNGCGLAASVKLIPLLVLAGWFGVPFVVAALFSLRWAWRNRPRRAWEPIKTDVREAYERVKD